MNYTETYNRYLETHAKPLETVEDAVLYLLAVRICGPCSECPTKLYCNGSCTNNNEYEKAKEIVKEAFDIDWVNQDEYVNDLLWRYLFEKPKPTKCDQEQVEKTCATCIHSEMHTSGIRFCKSWHNLTHENGFCYRYDSGKMEE